MLPAGVQACEAKVSQMRTQMGPFWLYNIYDECSSDQAERHTLDHWCGSQL